MTTRVARARKPRKVAPQPARAPSPIRAQSLHLASLQALRLAAAYRKLPGEFYWFARIEVGFARFYRVAAIKAGWALP